MSFHGGHDERNFHARQGGYVPRSTGYDSSQNYRGRGGGMNRGRGRGRYDMGSREHTYGTMPNNFGRQGYNSMRPSGKPKTYDRFSNLHRKLYIGNLGTAPPRKEEIEYEFAYYGKLLSVWLARSPPGFGYIEFEVEQDAIDAAEAMDGKMLKGREIKVEMAANRAEAEKLKTEAEKKAEAEARDRPPPQRRNRSRSPRAPRVSHQPTLTRAGATNRQRRYSKSSSSRSRSRSGSRSSSGSRSRSRSYSRSRSKSYSRSKSRSPSFDRHRRRRRSRS